MQQIHNDGDGLVGVGLGGHDGCDGGAELSLDGIHAGGIVCVGLLHAVNKHHPGLLAQHLPGALHAHAEAVLGIAHDDGALRGADGGQGFAGEVEVAGGIHNIDLDIIILHGSKGQGNGNLALDLLGVVVAGSIAVYGLAETVSPLGHKEHLLSQGGLAGSAVAQQANIANFIGSHSSVFSLRFWKMCRCAHSHSIRELYNIFQGMTNTIFCLFFVKNASLCPHFRLNRPKKQSYPRLLTPPAI